MPKAISYVRYSSKEQSKGDSYRRQLKAAEDYCANHGLELDTTIVDSGVSAFKGMNVKAGALSNLIEDVDNGRIPKGTTLIIESLDRLSRMEVEKALRLLMELVDDKGLIVVTLSDERVYKKGHLDMIALMTSLLVMSRAHEESAMKSRRLSAVWSKKKDDARDGKLMSAQKPSWLTLEGGELKIDEEKADRVREAFRILASGHGITATIRRLNERGILAPSGNTWARTSLRRLIDTQTVIGHYQPHTTVGGTRKPVGDIVKGYYPAIVDEDTYWNVRHKTKANGGSNASRKEQTGNLFSGLLTCDKCGAKVRFFNKGKGPKGGRYLGCRARSEGHGCDLPYMQYGQAEKVLLGWLHFEGVSLLNPEVPEVDFDALRAKLEENQKGQIRLIDFIQENGATEVVSNRFSQLQAEEAMLRSQLTEKPAESSSEDEFRRLVEHIQDPLGRKELARQIRRLKIEIIIGKDKIEVVDKVLFSRTYERGYWLWKGTNGQKLPVEMKAYGKRISGLRQNWGNDPEPKESSIKAEWDRFVSYPAPLRIYEELDDQLHVEWEDGDESLRN